MCTALLTVVLFVNIVLYLLTYFRIKHEEFNFKRGAKHTNELLKASHRAARSMSMFVAAFIIQWWALALYGIWQLAVDEVPMFVFQLATTFTNIGGILNGIVYFILRRQRQNSTPSPERDNLTLQTTLRQTMMNNNDIKRTLNGVDQGLLNIVKNDSKILLLKNPCDEDGEREDISFSSYEEQVVP